MVRLMGGLGVVEECDARILSWHGVHDLEVVGTRET
jgi:hypothetical protein